MAYEPLRVYSHGKVVEDIVFFTTTKAKNVLINSGIDPNKVEEGTLVEMVKSHQLVGRQCDRGALVTAPFEPEDTSEPRLVFERDKYMGNGFHDDREPCREQGSD